MRGWGESVRERSQEGVDNSKVKIVDVVDERQKSRMDHYSMMVVVPVVSAVVVVVGDETVVVFAIVYHHWVDEEEASPWRLCLRRLETKMPAVLP